ncbi:MAG TPA: hypothetical protein VMT11_09115 [Myxococcaceae bacterium]|nr:hypothetical protein [Myxococcaceae bacterium]
MVAVSAQLLVAFLLGAEGDEAGETSRAAPQVLESSTVAPPPNPTRLTIGARVELRSGHPLESLGLNTNPDAATTDLEINPLLAGRFNFRAGTFAVAYEPRIIIIASQADQKVYYLHKGRLALDIHPAPRWQFYVNSRSSFGEYDFNPLSGLQGSQPGTGLPQTPGSGPPAPPVLGTSPDKRFVNVLDFEASAGISYSLTSVWQWIASVGYLASGGADEAARAFVPLQRGPIAATGPRWTLSRQDTLLALVDVSHVRFTNGPISTLVNLTANWTHIWTPGLETDLLGGIGAFHSYNVPVQPPKSDLLPMGGISVRQTVAGRSVRWRNELQAVAAPAPDRIGGTVAERARGLLISTLSWKERIILGFTGEVGQTLGVAQRDARLEGKLTFGLAPQLALSIGGRAAWLEGYNLPGTKGFGWLGFLTVATYLGNAL